MTTQNTRHSQPQITGRAGEMSKTNRARLRELRAKKANQELMDPTEVNTLRGLQERDAAALTNDERRTLTGLERDAELHILDADGISELKSLRARLKGELTPEERTQLVALQGAADSRLTVSESKLLESLEAAAARQGIEG